ncbi:ORF6C domain-containing protein [Peptacetobacter sp. AB845]|uniref:Rha family transcriptional regulator n=1 Tax=Peptacetobacter sp. AB845 TaxID=3388429 RepID=UPI0039C937AE
MIENRVTITDLEPIAMVAEAREDVELVTMEEMEIDVNINKINLGGEEINVVSSRDIAEGLGKRHDNVMRDLDNILKSDSSKLSSQIIKSSYINERGKEYREYLLTKDGFTLYMFNIQGYNNFKMAYINKFNEMEQALRNPFKNMSKEMQSIWLLDTKTQELDKKIDTVAKDFNNFVENETLSTVMCDELSKKVRRVGTRLLGGHDSTAYKINKGHYRKVLFTDIYNQLKREFGIDVRTSYKILKRKDLQEAMEFLDRYRLPARLEEEIREINTQLEMEV